MNKTFLPRLCIMCSGLTLSVAAQAEVPTIPESSGSPALTIIGANPTVVRRPTSTARFSSTLLSGVGLNGKIIPGAAVEVAPLWVLSSQDVNLDEWRDTYRYRLYSGTTLSAATAERPEEDGKLVSLAWRTVWADRSDPRFDDNLVQCIQDIHSTPERIPESLSDPRSAVDSGLSIEKTANVDHCKIKAREARRETGLSLATALASSWLSESSQLSDLKHENVDVWMDVAYGWGVSKDFALGVAGVARLRINKHANSGDTGIQVRSQYKNTFKLNVASTWKPSDLSHIRESYKAFALGAEVNLRVYRDYWFNVETTYQGGEDHNVRGVLALGSLNYPF